MFNQWLGLLIDGNPEHLGTVGKWLREAGYDCVTAEDGLSGLREFFYQRPDIVIVDLGVREMSGWQVVERIREVSNGPIIVTSAEASLTSLKTGFDLAVDGFFVKPLKKEELLGRLNLVRERNFNDGGEGRWTYRSDGLTINWRSCEVFAQGRPASLTGTQFKLLAYLVQHRGWVLSHDQILSHVWGPDCLGDRDQVKLYIWYLRQKIEKDPSDPRLIVTRRGLGYSFAG